MKPGRIRLPVRRIAAFGPHSELLATSADYRYVISSLQAAEADEVDS